jgi:hypothetical protein
MTPMVGSFDMVSFVIRGAENQKQLTAEDAEDAEVKTRQNLADSTAALN